MEISISLEATIDAGTDIISCVGVPVDLFGIAGGSVTGGVWSGGLGLFNDATDLNAIYSPTAAEYNLGSVTLTLTSDAPPSPCNAVSDDVLITFASSAGVSAGVDIVMCEGTDVLLDGSISGSASSASWSGSTGIFSPGNTAVSYTHLTLPTKA